MFRIEYLKTKDEKEPFREWFYSLKDLKSRAKIQQKIDRIHSGNFGDHKYLMSGVYELRMTFGPGYRVYYGKTDDKVVFLLGGGVKDSQKKDIEKAVTLWKSWQR